MRKNIHIQSHQHERACGSMELGKNLINWNIGIIEENSDKYFTAVHLTMFH